MTIRGYEQAWQVRDHLVALKRERLNAVPGKTVIIDREIARFTEELECIREADKARIKAEFEAADRAVDEAANV
jgi:hypothetical protein